MNICWNRIRLALVALACVGLSGCDWVLLDSKGMVGLAQRDLILICIGLMLIVVIPAIVLTFVFAWRYRAGNTKAKYTPDWSHSTKVEIVVWGVPGAKDILRGTHERPQVGDGELHCPASLHPELYQVRHRRRGDRHPGVG